LNAVARDGRDDALARDLADAIVEAIGNEEVARAVNRHSTGNAEAGVFAAPPSPLKPWVPLPATVEMMPLGETLRMRLLSISAMKRLPALSTATPLGL
jgi:hypothetical protein